MQDFQQRVVDEKTALDEKILKLYAFIGTEVFWKLDSDERTRLRTQHGAMQEYSRILAERIAAFG